MLLYGSTVGCDISSSQTLYHRSNAARGVVAASGTRPCRCTPANHEAQVAIVQCCENVSHLRSRFTNASAGMSRGRATKQLFFCRGWSQISHPRSNPHIAECGTKRRHVYALRGWPWNTHNLCWTETRSRGVHKPLNAQRDLNFFNSYCYWYRIGSLYACFQCRLFDMGRLRHMRNNSPDLWRNGSYCWGNLVIFKGLYFLGHPPPNLRYGCCGRRTLCRLNTPRVR